jgi:predicted permease
LRGLWNRIAFLARRSHRLAELDEEMQLHLELRERQLRAEGMAPEDAARAARLGFGNRTAVAERSLEAWGWGWLDGLGRDLRHGARLLRRSPLFSAVVVLTLALGIGPNVAVFSVMNAIVLRHLPVPEPERLVTLRIPRQPDGMNNTGDSSLSFSYAVHARLREEHAAFRDLMAYVPLGITRTAVRQGLVPEEATVDMVSGNFFTGLRVGAAHGRLLTSDDETRHAQAVVLSHAYWVRRFGRDPRVVGQTLHVKGIPFTIVGVSAAGFAGAERKIPTDLWLPLQDRPELSPWGMVRERSYLRTPDWWCLMMIGRLADGVSEAEALARLQPVFFQAAYAHKGGPNKDEKVPILSFSSTRGIAGLRQAYEEPLRLLFAMVILVVAIASGNVALLLVARNATRQREFAVRVALGGGRLQLLRQLVAESLLLVVAAAGLGWLFALGATEVVRSWAGLEVDLAPDRRVLLFTLAVSALATLLFGLAPLRGASRAPMAAGLRGSAPGARRVQGSSWARKAVVAVQVALCLVLLVGASLLVRTLRNLERIPLGLRPAGLLVFGLSPQPGTGAASPAGTVRFYQSVRDRLRGLPGVEAVTLMENRIGSGWSNNSDAYVDGQRPRDANAGVRWNVVGPDYFHTLGIPLRHGREIDDRDNAAAPRVAVVNETFVERFLAGGSPLGHTVEIGGDGAAPLEIIGVAADSKYTGVREDPRPMAYLPYAQSDHTSAMHVEVRAAGDAARLWPVVQRAMRELAPDLPLEQPRTQQQEFARNLADDRLFAWLAGFFGLLAAALVATGLYATLIYAVSRRTVEIGVRVALGARPATVSWVVLRESLLVCGAGIAAGLPAALIASRVLRSSLYGVAPGDPVTVALSLVGLMVIALGASLVPAYRAASVDPMVALRAE